jgi:NhaC family Na+:H+ antiporter
MVVLVLKKCESYLYNESQFHIKYNNRTKHVLYIGIYPQYCIENISTQKKQDPIQTISFNGVWDIWFKGYTATTDFEPVNTLLSKGGIESMFFTMSLVILALGFGGLLFVTGIIPSILETLQRKLQRVRSIIVSTALTAIGINVLIGEQYLSILLTGETYKNLYNKVGLSNKALSRTLEDAGTVINPLVPWSVCGVFIADVLGVPVLTYLPFAFFCLLSPLITVIFGGKSNSAQIQKQA